MTGGGPVPGSENGKPGAQELANEPVLVGQGQGSDFRTVMAFLKAKVPQYSEKVKGVEGGVPQSSSVLLPPVKIGPGCMQPSPQLRADYEGRSRPLSASSIVSWAGSSLSMNELEELLCCPITQVCWGEGINLLGSSEDKSGNGMM